MVDWPKMWGKFDSWVARREKGERCSQCLHENGELPDWQEQQIKIQQLVEAQLKEKKNG